MNSNHLQYILFTGDLNQRKYPALSSTSGHQRVSLGTILQAFPAALASEEPLLETREVTTVPRTPLLQQGTETQSEIILIPCVKFPVGVRKSLKALPQLGDDRWRVIKQNIWKFKS